MAKSLTYDQLYPNRFLHAEDFQGKEPTLTIASVDLEELEGDKGKQTKVIVSFAETKKKWVCPKSCGIPMKKMWGVDTGKWVGRQITLYPQEVDSFGDRVLAIRVRGAPELTAPIVWQEQLGKKKAKFKLIPTGKNRSTPPVPTTPPVAPEEIDGLPDVPPDDEADLAAEAAERERQEFEADRR